MIYIYIDNLILIVGIIFIGVFLIYKIVQVHASFCSLYFATAYFCRMLPVNIINHNKRLIDMQLWKYKPNSQNVIEKYKKIYYNVLEQNFNISYISLINYNKSILEQTYTHQLY